MADANAAKGKNRARVGPYSKPDMLAKLDGRRREAKLMKRTLDDLTAHVGGSPSVMQRLLIERMTRVRLQIDLFDAKLTSGDWTACDSRTYGGLLNAYRLLAREIGVKGAEDKPQSPDDVLREVYARYGRRTDTEAGE